MLGAAGGSRGGHDHEYRDVVRRLVLGKIQHYLAEIDVRGRTGGCGLHRDLDWIRGVHCATRRLDREQVAALAEAPGRAESESGSGRVASGKVRPLTHDNALVLSPAWSADGRSIYFASSRGGTLNIWKIAENGSQLEQITSGQGDDAHLDISMDGKRMVFSSFRVNINVAQLDLETAGQQIPKLLIADAARNQFGPSYSPDGKHLAYFSNLKGVEKESI